MRAFLFDGMAQMGHDDTMSYMRRVRVPPPPDRTPEPVSVKIDFEWHELGPIHVDYDENTITLPDGLRTSGVYFIRSSLRGGNAPDDDACYVGRALTNPEAKSPSTAEQRVVLHMSEDDKKFKENLSHVEGWVEVSMAKNIRVNDQPLEQEMLQDERLLEAVESTGVIASMDYFNLHNKR